MATPPDHYCRLGIEGPDTASQADIRRAYIRLSRLHHPDKPTGSTEAFRALKDAYDILYIGAEHSDAYRKKSYDEQWRRKYGSTTEAKERKVNFTTHASKAKPGTFWNFESAFGPDTANAQKKNFDTARCAEEKTSVEKGSHRPQQQSRARALHQDRLSTRTSATLETRLLVALRMFLRPFTKSRMISLVGGMKNGLARTRLLRGIMQQMLLRIGYSKITSELRIRKKRKIIGTVITVPRSAQKVEKTIYILRSVRLVDEISTEVTERPPWQPLPKRRRYHP